MKIPPKAKSAETEKNKTDSLSKQARVQVCECVGGNQYQVRLVFSPELVEPPLVKNVIVSKNFSERLNFVRAFNRLMLALRTNSRARELTN